MMNRRNAVLILGMHRSGTSCLTGCLEETGLYLGNVNQKAGFNKKGNREDRAIMEFHDSELARAGYAWDDPPSGTFDISAPSHEKLRTLIARFPDDQIWGVKDPRSLFFLPAWEQHITPHYIGTFRHPSAVIASLTHRAKAWEQEMSEDKALYLWARYNQQMLAQYAKAPFPVIRFDTAVEDYNAKVKRVSQDLGLNPDHALAFREASLETHKSDANVPASVKIIWEALNAIAI